MFAETMISQHTDRFKIGRKWIVFLNSCEIKGPLGIQKVGQSTIRLLKLFIERQGELISNEEIQDKVWHEVIVSESTLRKSISNLRSYFVLDGESCLEIERVRSEGYRLSGNVEVRQMGFGLYRLKKGFRASMPYLLTSLVSVSIFYLFLSFNRQSQAEIQRITKTGKDHSPNISDEGNQLIYASSQNNIDGRTDIFRYDLEEKKNVQLTATPNFEIEPTISPDGRQIAYFQDRSSLVSLQLYDLNLEVARSVLTFDNIPWAAGIDWSPKQEHLVVTGLEGSSNCSRLYKVDLETNDKQQITNPHVNTIGDYFPKYSPDGTQLAFLRATQLSWHFLPLFVQVGDIYVMDLLTGKLRKVTYQPSEISGLDWTPDGKSIVYSSGDQLYNFQINLAGVETEENKVIYQTDKLIGHIDASDQLYFEERRYNYRFVEIPLGDSLFQQLKYIPMDSGKIWYPQYNIQEDKLAYVHTLSGHPEVWITDLNTTEPFQLTAFAGPFLERPRWSPDGRFITISSSSRNNQDIHIINALTGEITESIETAFQENSPTWSEDGKRLYFSANYNGINQIWSLSPEEHSEEPHLVTNISADFFVVRDDFVYHSSTNREGIWKTSLSDSSSINIAPQVSKRETRNWDIVDQHLAYTTHGSRGRYLHLFSLKEMSLIKRQEIRNLSIYYPGIAVNLNTRKVLGLSFTNSQSDIVALSNYQ